MAKRKVTSPLIFSDVFSECRLRFKKVEDKTNPIYCPGTKEKKAVCFILVFAVSYPPSLGPKGSRKTTLFAQALTVTSTWKTIRRTKTKFSFHP